VKFAPWMIERSNGHTWSFPRCAKRCDEFTRAGVWDGRSAKNKRGYSRIPMKLSLDALRSGQRLRIRIPVSPLSFVNALQTGSFGTWVHFRKVRRQPLLPIREGFPVIRPTVC
jgi:hypothetical protein